MKRKPFTRTAAVLTLLALAMSGVIPIVTARAAIYFVRTNGNDTLPGTSWAEAKRHVAAAVAAATAGDEIWVAHGTYSEHLTLKPDLALYGGFAGTESTRAQRDWTNHLCVLWGATNQAVVTITNAGPATRLDGFTVGGGMGIHGGGIKTIGAGPVIAHCTVRNNITDGAGAGISIWGFQLLSSTNANFPVITNNVIVNSQYNGLSIRARNLDGKMQNITIANNTFYGAGNTCLQVSNGDIASNVVIANNAIYQSSGTATAFNAAQGIAGITLANNLYYGAANASSPGLVLGPAPAAVFANASATLGQMDLYPLTAGALIDAAVNAYAPADDFNALNRPRNGTADIGAYEYYYDTNPGWKLAASFRSVGIPGDVTLDGHVNVFDLQRMAVSWNKQQGDSGYDPACDFTGDKKVNIFDLQKMAQNWNRF